MAITLKQAFALNGTPDLDSFNDLQDQCKNTNYFSDSKPINHLSSWEGYWYGAGYDLSISLSSTSVAATGGTITVTYTIKEHRSTGDVLVSGVKPTVTSTLGTISNITTTNTNGVGTATITIDNNKSLSSKSIKVTVSSTLGGSVISKESTATQAAGYYTYGSITINTFTYGAVGAAGGTSSPSITYSQPYGWNGSTSGAGTINGNGDDDYTTYKETGAHSALTVNESTGVVTWTKNNATANTVDASRSGKITATVTRNGKTATKEVTTTQNAEKISSYGAWSFTVKANTSSIAATGGSVTFTISRPTRTITYDTGDTQTETASSGTFALTRSNSNFTLSTTSISMTSSSLPTFTLSVGATGAAAVAAISSTVTAAFTASSPTTGTTTKSITSSSVTRAASSLVGDYYRFSTFSVAKSSFTAATGTTTLSMVVQKRSKYTGDQYTNWATITPASGTLSVTAGTGGSVGAITYGATSTCTITVAANTGSERTIAISGKYNTDKATSSLNISQYADAISSTTYGEVVAGTITNKTIPASGTTTNYTATAGNGSQVITYSWVSGKANTTKTITIAPKQDASISATASSKGTNISGKTTVKSQAVTWTGEGGKSASGTMYIYQAANVVTKVAPSISTFSYATIGAGATSASPTVTNGNTAFTFTSGSTTTTTPSTTYGTLTVSNAYTLASSQNGFTAVNSSTGVLTATSRGTTYGATTRSSANVTLTRSATWTPKSGYGDSVSGSANKEISCTQEANTITIQSVTSTPGTLTNTSFSANQNTKDVSSTSATASAVLVYASGSKVTTSYSATYYGSWTFHGYSASTNQTWATVNSTNWDKTNVTAASRGTTEGNARTATLTRTENGFTFTLKSDYGGASKKSASTSCSCTLTQAANAANAYYGDLTATASYGSKNASQGTVSPTLSVKCNGYYTSGSKGAQATLTSSNYTIAATMTTGNGASIASATGVITWKANTGSARTSNTATLKITTKSPYLNSSGSALTVSPTAKSTQSADSISSYKDLVVDLSYANAAPSTANVTVNPSLTVKAIPVYVSGKSASQVTIPSSGYSVSYTESTASSYASVSSAGVITWNSNAGKTIDRTVGITANVTCNSTYSGLTGSDTVTAKHTKDSIKTYGDVTASIGTGITAANGSATVSGTQTLTWQSGHTSNGTITYAITKQYIGTTSTATSGTNITRYSLSGTKLSHTTMGTNTGYDIVVVTATGQGSKTKTAQTSVYNGVTSTEYGNYKTTISLANATPTCSSGTTTATIKTYRQARSKYTSGSYGSYGSDTLATVGTPTVSESVNWLSVGTVSNSTTGTYTATVTYNANSKNTSTREETITATANSVSGTVKLTQGKDTYTDSTEYGNYKTTATLANSSPTCSSGTTTLTIKITRQSRTKRVWTCGGTEYLSWSADKAYSKTPTVTDNVDWLSVGTVSASSTTGTYTATVTYNANSKNTNTRTATITASCNTNGTASLTQGKDSYTDSGGVTSTTYGNWGGGAISFNSTTALSAAADSRTVTIQPWSRTKTVKTTAKIRTWTCGGTETLVAASSNTSTEYYTGTVAISENGSYTSLSATSYTASSSAKTLTLTKTTCGANITSAATVTVTANPSTDGPATTTKSISQTANALTKVAISVKSGTTPIPYGGGTVTLQCKGTFTSGTHAVTPSWIGVTNGTLSSTTAKNPTLTVGANSGAERNVTVSAKYPNNSTGKTASFTIKQAGVPVNFTLPIDFYVQSTRGVSGAADCSFKCSGDAVLGSQSRQAFSFNSGLIREYYNTSGSFKESKVLNLASLNVTTNTTNFSDYRLDWGFALHASGGYGSSTSSTIQYKMYWQIEKYDGTIYELMSTSYPKTSTNYVSVDYLTTNESQTQSSNPISIANGDRIRITIVI